MRSLSHHSSPRSRTKSPLASSSRKEKECNRRNNEPQPSGSTATVNDEETIELPTLRLVDRDKTPCLQSLLNRVRDEGVITEALDKIQSECETLLSACVIRSRTLQNEIELMAIAEENKPKKTANITLSKKRDRDVKCDEKNASFGGTASHRSKKIKFSSQYTDEESTEEFSQDESIGARSNFGRRIVLPLVPVTTTPIAKNDVTNKFWEMVETYFSNITKEDLKLLENMLAMYSSNWSEKFDKIPPLGVHFSCYSVPIAGQNNGCSEMSIDENQSQRSSISDALLSSIVHKPCTICTVTKVVLKREVMKSVDENNEGAGQTIDCNHKDNCADGLLSQPGTLTALEECNRKLPFFHTLNCFEGRLRKKLKEIGFFKEESNNAEDEVCTHLKLCQDQLKNYAERNKNALERLLQLSAYQKEKRELEVQLEDINRGIMEMSQKSMLLKTKKKNLSKFECEEAWKLLKQRNHLTTKLGELRPPCD